MNDEITRRQFLARTSLILLYETAAGEIYCVRVPATTDMALATPIAPPLPQAPTGLMGTISGDSVVLTWNPNPATDQVIGYQVWCAPSGGDAVQIATTLTTEYTDSSTSLTPGSSWLYYVIAVSASGNSQPSAAVKATIPHQNQALGTLTLVNTSSTMQAAGAVTPMFGWVFKEGDVPNGTAPQFQVGGVNQPFSWGCQSYWSDGSLKFASFMLRTTASITGNGTLSISVMNGGTVPISSARTLTEVEAQSIVVKTTAAPVTGANITGTWSAWLNGDANQVEALVYLDGAAGKIWRVLTHFAQMQGGAAHGQLECYHYIVALTDVNGNLGGFRHLGRICQPWYNNDTPAKNYRAFSIITWQYGAVPTTTTLVGADSSTWPFNTTPTFTCTGSGTVTLNAIIPSSWYSGEGARGWYVPGYLTGASLPAGTDANTIYFASGVQNTTNLTLGSTTWFGGNAVTGSTGIGTFNPVIVVPPFCSIFTATTDARWNFFQGTGSIAADGTIRTQFDHTYWHTTQVLPPFDLSLAASDNSTFGYNWSPVSIGPAVQSQETTGDRDDLGEITAWSARHFYNQSAGSETLNRIVGLSNGLTAACFRDATTHTIVNLGDPTTTYTGMPASVANTVSCGYGTGSGFITGFTVPPADCGPFVWSQNSPNHKPCYCAYVYLITGEPQFLDMLIEEANSGISFYPADTSHRNPSSPIQVYGITTGFAEPRALAWSTRDVAWAAALYPDKSPDGVQIKTYFRDRLSQSAQHANAILSASVSNSYVASNAYWFPIINWGGTQAVGQSSSWQTSYMALGMAIAAGAASDLDAKTFLANRMTWLNHLLSAFGGFVMYGYYENSGPTVARWPVVSSDAEWGVSTPYSQFSWASGTPGVFTIIPKVDTGWILTNGDKLVFDDAGTVPGGLSSDVPYYAVNVSGNTGNLASSPGGAALAVTTSDSNGSAQTWFIPAVMPPATANAQPSPSSGSSGGYIALSHAVMSWAQALGVSGVTSLISDATARLTSTGVSFTSDPRFAMQTSF